MINKRQRFKMVALSKELKFSTISTIGRISILIFSNDINKITITHRCFLFIMYGFDMSNQQTKNLWLKNN